MTKGTPIISLHALEAMYSIYMHQDGNALFLGNYLGKSFADACIKMIMDREWSLKEYNVKNNTYRNSKFYETEEEAKQG